MIGNLWDTIVSTLTALGLVLDNTETDSLADRHYVIKLPGDQRDDKITTFARSYVNRDIRIRLQYRDRKDARFPLLVAQDIEMMTVALRKTGGFLFEASAIEERQGGIIAEVRLSARDSMD